MGTLIYGIITYLEYCMQWYAIWLWFSAVVLFEASISKSFKEMYLENIENYPADNCCKPNKYRFLFKNLSGLSWKGIPKEIYYILIIEYYLLWIYTIIISFFILLENERTAYIISVTYYCIVAALFIYCASSLSLRSFLSRYKLFNKHNIKYYFSSKNWPYPRKVGNCQIVKERRKWRKTFVTVSIIETGEIKDKVLLSGKKRQGENPVYSIYEICNVYYIL